MLGWGLGWIVMVLPWAGDGFGGKKEISSKMDLRLGG